jgi:RHH-type proline utilization regulon transcriptional repressor/proline dehydrogenase/delta 1-pyrroline-5-carboxylate dehydrogenase
LDAFLLEFGLSNAEGVALMCLAEALLRVPDALTADRLIAEKIRGGNWGAHSGKSESLFVNASTWGLMLTGQLVSLDAEITQHTDSWLKRLTATMGEPVIRTAVMQAMKIMGGQYVLGRTIEEGMKRGRVNKMTRAPGSRSICWAKAPALTYDAQQYLRAYSKAIDEIGKTIRPQRTGRTGQWHFGKTQRPAPALLLRPTAASDGRTAAQNQATVPAGQAIQYWPID